MGNLVSTDINQENEFTPAYSVGLGNAPILIVTTGTWVGTLSIQIKMATGESFIDLPNEKYTSNFDAKAVNLPINGELRVGFKTGDFTSGTATIHITQ